MIDLNEDFDEELNIEIRRLRDALKEIAQLGSYYAQTPYSACVARKTLGCKHMPFDDYLRSEDVSDDQ